VTFFSLSRTTHVYSTASHTVIVPSLPSLPMSSPDRAASLSPVSQSPSHPHEYRFPASIVGPTPASARSATVPASPAAGPPSRCARPAPVRSRCPCRQRCPRVEYRARHF
jgi:hypothetical protein